jgi:hypothetical protein
MLSGFPISEEYTLHPSPLPEGEGAKIGICGGFGMPSCIRLLEHITDASDCMQELGLKIGVDLFP